MVTVMALAEYTVTIQNATRFERALGHTVLLFALVRHFAHNRTTVRITDGQLDSESNKNDR